MADLVTGLKNPREIQEIKDINGSTSSTTDGAIKLLSRLKELEGTLDESSNLKRSIEDNFFDKKLKGYNVDDVISALKKIESKQEEDKKEEKEIEEVTKEEEIIEIEPEVELTSNVDVKKLVEDYEDYLKKGYSDKEARDKIYRDNPNTNKDNVERFINRQQEIYKDTLAKIKESQEKESNKPIDRAKEEKKEVEIKQINEEKIARIIATEAAIKEEALSIKLGEEKAKTIIEEVTKEVIIPHVVDKEMIEESGLNKYSTLKEDDRQELMETFKIIDSKIEIEKKVEEVTTQIIEELKQDSRLEDKIELKKIAEIENVVRNEIYGQLSEEVVGTGEIKSEFTTEIFKVIQPTETIDLTPELKEMINVPIEKIGQETKNWVQSNDIKLSEIKGQLLEDKVQQQIYSENKNISPDQAKNIQEYTKILKNIYTTPSELNPYRKELLIETQASGVNKDKTQEAWTDLKGLTRVLRMKPKEFDEFLAKYKEVKKGMGDIKLPFKIKESRSLDTIVRLADNPAIKKLINRAQNYIRIFDRVSNITSGRFISNFTQRIGLKFGRVLVNRVGNQAFKSFAENSMQVLAKNGLKKGGEMILKGLLKGGVKVAAKIGAEAGGAMAVAGGAATVPVAGWIVALVIVAIEAIKVVFKIAGKIAKKLGIDIGAKKFLQETFGKFFGGIMDFGLKVGAVIMAPAALAGLGGAVAIITPVIICVVIGIFAIQLFTGNQVSSLVPAQNQGSGLQIVPTRDPSIPIPEGCPVGWPISSGRITQGPNGAYSHLGLQAIDISESDGLPIRATHDGLAMPQSGIASNGVMGYEVVIIGTCQGKEFKTVYSHLPGQIISGQKTVKAGEVIGYVDDSGLSSNPHLHYQLKGLGSINGYLPKNIPDGYNLGSQVIYVP